MKDFLICANGTWQQLKAGSPGQAVQMYLDSLDPSEDYIPKKADVYEILTKNDTLYPKILRNEQAKGKYLPPKEDTEV